MREGDGWIMTRVDRQAEGKVNERGALEVE
jgi:hypothetical protein